MPGTKGQHGLPSKRKKRKFAGNQHTKKAKVDAEVAEIDERLTGASCSKIRNNPDFAVAADMTTHYVIVAWMSIFGGISDLMQCKKCQGDVRFEKKNAHGLGFQLSLECNCLVTRTLDSSPTQLNEAKNNKSYEINRKMVFIMRLLGVGFNGLNLFCGMMDLCSGFSNKMFYNILNNMSTACQTVFEKTIKQAADEENSKNVQDGKPEEILTVSGDGTWAKRGFKSLLGVISLIGKQTGKIVDLIVKCSFCVTCARVLKKLTKRQFEVWYDNHKEVCTANHTGSAGKMEVDGVIEMFRRSLDLHGVKYGNYIGDGDSKTFTNLAEDQPYGPDFKIRKLECVLHVSKRMYSRLKELKKKLTLSKKITAENEKSATAAVAASATVADAVAPVVAAPTAAAATPDEESDNVVVAPAAKKRGRPAKTLSVPKNVKKFAPKKKKQPAAKEDPKVNLTDKVIREMSVYYSLAIQRHGNSVDEMRSEIMAGFYHKISTDEFPQHDMCNIEWCKYIQHTAAGVPFQHPPPLDPKIQDAVKEIYESLTNEDLLERCLGLNNQNNNESYNSCLWQLAPKHLYCGKNTLQIAAWISASVYNEGSMTLLMMLKAMGVRVGPLALNYCTNANKARKIQCSRRSSEASKEGRIKKKQEDQAKFAEIEEEEGLLYAAGIAD